MPGAVDPLYVRARTALLDALDALEPHLDALVLVGAQAVCLHTSDTELAVAEYTTDATSQSLPASSPTRHCSETRSPPTASPHAYTPVAGSVRTASTSTSWCPKRSPAPELAAPGSAGTANAPPGAPRDWKARSSTAGDAPSRRSSRATRGLR